MERLTVPDEPIEGGVKRAVIDAREVRKHAMTIYWRLKKYEDTGIDPERFAEIDRSYQEMARELAELRKQKWIPVKNYLPPQPKENPIFENKPLELYLVCLEKTDYPFKAIWNGEFFTDGWGKIPAVAWMPLPEPYKETKDDE